MSEVKQNYLPTMSENCELETILYLIFKVYHLKKNSLLIT
jgi:hypothetical protein